jgi:hypothetical protein
VSVIENRFGVEPLAPVQSTTTCRYIGSRSRPCHSTGRDLAEIVDHDLADLASPDKSPSRIGCDSDLDSNTGSGSPARTALSDCSALL